MMLTNIFSALLVFVSYINCEETKVTIKLGSIYGINEIIDNKRVSVFLGIPFAVPAIGSLRFKKPKPITEKWTKPIHATKWPHICMQDTLLYRYYNEVSEDCLYLNVWTPANIDEDFTKKLKTVIVFIHGGAFAHMGISHRHYNASVLSSFGDVVVVTMNYRLGAFGFLYAATSDAPGNVGLYDQALALEWVQENIAYFGGDPKQVTLFGQSAGAMSVSFHLQSPVSRHINRAIIMSGSIVTNTLFDGKEEALNKTVALLKILGCKANDEKESGVTNMQLECIRDIDPEKIVEAQSASEILSLSRALPVVSFMPIFGLGKAFVSVEQKEMSDKKCFINGIDVLVGTVANEGYIMHLLIEMAELFPYMWQRKINNILVQIFNNLSDALLDSVKSQNILLHLASKGFELVSFNYKWKEKLRLAAKLFLKELYDEKVEEMLMFYFNDIDEESSDEARMAYYTALGDVMFNCEVLRLSEVISKSNNVYQYLFDYSLANVYDNLGLCHLSKVCHGNEIPLTFGTVSHPNDIAVSRKWIKIITDFAKIGAVEWPKHGNNWSPYYEFTGNESNNRLLNNYRGDACKLLKPILEKHSAL